MIRIAYSVCCDFCEDEILSDVHRSEVQMAFPTPPVNTIGRGIACDSCLHIALEAVGKKLKETK
jgi:hypothetical protein